MPTTTQPGFYDPTFADLVLDIPTEAGHATVLQLARKEGLFVGVSSGAAARAAFQVAAALECGVVIALFPEAGYKYLSDKSFFRR